MRFRTFAFVVASASALLLAGCAPPEPRHAKDPSDFLRTSVQGEAPLHRRVSYLRSSNTGAVRVIYVHGTPGEARGWVDYVFEPVPGTESAALDRPGFGLSEPEGAVTDLEAQAAAVVALLPSNGSKVVLVGHSLGGAVVARVAAEHPERVLALVLLASSLDPAQEKIHPMQPIGQMWPFSALLPRSMRNANEELMVFKHQLDLLEPMLVRVTAPTIIVHGTKDDLVPFANVAYMQSHLTKALCIKTKVLEGVNHFLPWNSEAVVRQAIAWAAHPDCGAK